LSRNGEREDSSFRWATVLSRAQSGLASGVRMRATSNWLAPNGRMRARSPSLSRPASNPCVQSRRLSGSTSQRWSTPAPR
jgi:hypothetical protein